jgi:hypothetical protein
LSLIELILEEQQRWVRDYNPYLVHGLKETADVDIFKRLVPFTREYPVYVRRLLYTPDYWRVKTLPQMICSAASDGRLAILKHLMEEEGAKRLEIWHRNRRL